MINLDNFYVYFKEDPNYIRLRELETYFDNNDKVKKLIERKQELSKNIINSRYIGLKENAKESKKEYDALNKEIENVPLLDEYLDLLDYFYDLTKEITSYIENKINQKLNN